MPRVRKGAARRRAANRVFKKVKGYFGGRRKLLRTAKESIVRAAAYATRDRRTRKRTFRRLWIRRLSAAAAQHGLSYNQLVHGLHEADVLLNRKVLADLAICDPAAFEGIAKVAAEAIK